MLLKSSYAHKYFWTFPLFVLVYFACQPKVQVEDQIVAKVFNKKLYVSELNDVLSGDLNPEDSTLIRNAFVENWIRENLILIEAERNIPVDLQIDELVDEYRSSLIKQSFEKRFVESSLDTNVTQEELLNYYEANKSQYVLESMICQLFFAKIYKDSIRSDEELEQLENTWSTLLDIPTDSIAASEEYKRFLEYCNEEALVYVLDTGKWTKLDIIKEAMPPGTVSQDIIKFTKRIEINDEGYYFFLKVFDVKEKKEIAPLSFIKSQARRVILHQRKMILMDKLREELYNQAVQNNRIKTNL